MECRPELLPFRSCNCRSWCNTQRVLTTSFFESIANKGFATRSWRWFIDDVILIIPSLDTAVLSPFYTSFAPLSNFDDFPLRFNSILIVHSPWRLKYMTTWRMKAKTHVSLCRRFQLVDALWLRHLAHLRHFDLHLADCDADHILHRRQAEAASQLLTSRTLHVLLTTLSLYHSRALANVTWFEWLAFF